MRSHTSSGERPQNIMYDKRVHRGSAYVTREVRRSLSLRVQLVFLAVD